MGLRPARIYRDMDAKRPYTRRAVRVHNKDYIRGGVPGSKLHVFETGNRKAEFNSEAYIYPKSGNTTIRHNALEAARIASTAYLKKYMEESEFFIKIRVYPHHILRAHAQAAIAQADRFYQGMSHPFGKPNGAAARVRKNQAIMSIKFDKSNLVHAKEAMRRAGDKIPGGVRVEILSA